MTSTKSDSTLDKHKRKIEKRDNEIADLKQRLRTSSGSGRRPPTCTSGVTTSLRAR